MRRRGFRNATVAFGIATGVSLGVVGYNVNEIKTAEQEAALTTSESQEAEAARLNSYGLLVQSLAVTALSGTATLVASRAYSQTAE